MSKYLSAPFLIQEGLNDFNETLQYEEESRKIIKKYAKEENISVDKFVKKIRQRRKLKRRAANIGLKYWPALYPVIDDNTQKRLYTDPKVFITAEKILYNHLPLDAEGQKYYWGSNGGISTGGWDGSGTKGLSNYQVHIMWLRCGRKINGKFAYQVASKTIAKAGDSLSFFKNYVRGRNWLNDRFFVKFNICRKAIAVLGRLSPELRTVAILSLYQKFQNNKRLGYKDCDDDVEGPHEYIPCPVRIRDLDWQAVKERQELIRKGGIKVRAALAGDKRAGQLLKLDGLESLVYKICPAYPKIDITLAKRICLGETPVELAEGLLSKKEAHAWLINPYFATTSGIISTSIIKNSILHFLNIKLCVSLPVNASYFNFRSIKILRWVEYLNKTNKFEVLTKPRRVRIPGTDRYFGRTYWNIIDEVQEEDILTGKDSAHDVFERAGRRKSVEFYKESLKQNRKLCDIPEFATTLPRWIKYLSTSAELAIEGKELAHCVGGYLSAVEQGNCHILSIRTQYGWSTVELDNYFHIAQHYGYNNSDPPKRNNDLLRAWINRITRKPKYKCNYCKDTKKIALLLSIVPCAVC